MSKSASILDAKLNYLYSRMGGSTVKLGLETTRALMRAMEVDPAQLPCVHVAGTNGKGSVSAMLESVLRELGLRTVRFNFRGVGRSEGGFDDGYGETDDLFAVTEWVRRTRPDDTLFLGGFSFGAYVSVRAASSLSLGQLISIAPPVDRYEFASLPRPQCPWLVVQGDEDDVVTVESVRAWADRTEPPPDLIVMPQAGHFFHRRLMDLRGLLKNGVRDQLPAARRGHTPP